MARGSKQKATRGGGPALVIKAFTDSAERVGKDAALYATLGVAGFCALAAGASGPAVVGLTITIAGAWIGTKYVNAHVALQEERNRIEKLRVERGEQLLTNHRSHEARTHLPRTRKKADQENGPAAT